MAKLTTKTTQPTGRYRSFDSAYTEIKLNGVCVGSIDDKAPHKIKLYVTKTEEDKAKNPNDPCEWKRVMLKHESASLNDAKQFVKDNSEQIQKQFQLHDKNS